MVTFQIIYRVFMINDFNICIDNNLLEKTIHIQKNFIAVDNI